MANNEDAFKKVVSHAKEYGFISLQAKSTTDSVPYTTTVNWVQNSRTISSSIGGNRWYSITKIL